MIIANCPRCGAMNATTTCTKCGWSQFTTSTVSTGVLLDDYKRLLLENNSLTVRIAELEGFINQLIEAGELLAECSDYEGGKIAWDALVKDWKEREE